MRGVQIACTSVRRIARLRLRFHQPLGLGHRHLESHRGGAPLPPLSVASHEAG